MRLPTLFSLLVCAVTSAFSATKEPAPPLELPLKATRVQARIDGMVARVDVFQRFENKNREAIEAIYTFPLPTGAAVSEYSFKMAGREVRGKLQTREVARKTYEAAREAGKTTSLLEQERPNVFTQSVANIPSRTEVEVHLQYDLSLEPDDGLYAFVFPTVVGPRFCPASMSDAQVAAIAPPVLAAGSDNPHRFSIEVLLDAGLPVHDLKSVWHKIRTRGEQAGGVFSGPVKVELARQEDIPDRDFRLEYRLSGKDIQATLLAQKATAGQGGHFLLMVEPPVKPDAIAAGQEILLLIDQSGSMGGAPLGTVQDAARYVVENLRPIDRIQIVSFANTAKKMADTSLAVDATNRGRILSWINGLRSEGGTEMLSGLKEALGAPKTRGLARHIVLLTDGYIGNEDQIFRAIHDGIQPGTTLHCFAVGSSVNHHLLEGAAKEGHGLNLPLELGRDPSKTLDRFLERLSVGVLSDISLDWGGLKVADLEPQMIQDLFLGSPLVIAGRFDAPGTGTLAIQGKRRGKAVTIPVPVNFAAADTLHPALPRLWARRRLAIYTNPDTRDSAKGTELALQYRLLSPWTSFVAVMDSVVNQGGKSVRIDVPVELPRGVSPNAVGRNRGNMGSSMDLGAGKIEGYLDNPQTLYLLQEDNDGLNGLSLEREFKDQLSASNHACTPVPAQVWDLALPFGKELRAQGDLLKALQSWISSVNWPAHLGPVSVRLRLLVEPSGKISQVVLASGQEPTKAERALLDGLLGRDFQVKTEGFAVAEMNVSIGGMRCAEIPGEIEKRP
jgi:Ca-activated chloride channel family protein